MKIILKYVLVVFLLQVSFSIYAQKAAVSGGKQEYENFSYVKTSDYLLKVAENGYVNREILEKLANSFYFNNNMKQAARWYAELFNNTSSEIDSEYYFRYAMALRGIENYKASDKWMDKFIQINPNDTRAQNFKSNKDYMSDIMSNSSNLIEVTNLDFNSEYSDFGTIFNGENLIFASSNADSSAEKYQWNNQPYLDLFKVYKLSDTEYSSPVALSASINTKFHESSAAYSPDFKTIYFTRNNYFKNRPKKDKDGVNRLQMFRAKLNESGKWDDITPIHFNSSEYSVAHPSVNKEGSRLYFASDMDGSKGESDIYVVDINEDGSLGKPRNLGMSINTEGKDSFPFIHKNGDLYYSTMGFPGLGGYDIFMVQDLDSKVAYDNLENLIVKNIGKPFNSSADDFAFYKSEDGNEGYFTSNRPGGKGDDDIYSFKPRNCNQIVSGVVTDANTDELIPGAKVILFDNLGKELQSVVVGRDAKYTFNVECNEEYLARGSKEKYNTDEERFETSDTELALALDIALTPDEIEIKPCDDLAKTLNIPLIYFDLNKSKIKYVAEVELQKVLMVLNQYPSMTLDIRSHTDCRASYAYNLKLSNNRANATREYLIRSGISGNRLTAKGYGESRLVNNCGCEPDNNSNCTEFQHQQNRRSEFIVTSFKGKVCNN